jgi:hypothetical protein
MVVIGTQRYRQVGGGTLRRFPYFSRNQRKSPKIGLLEKKNGKSGANRGNMVDKGGLWGTEWRE